MTKKNSWKISKFCPQASEVQKSKKLSIFPNFHFLVFEQNLYFVQKFTVDQKLKILKNWNFFRFLHFWSLKTKFWNYPGKFLITQKFLFCSKIHCWPKTENFEKLKLFSIFALLKPEDKILKLSKKISYYSKIFILFKNSLLTKNWKCWKTETFRFLHFWSLKTKFWNYPRTFLIYTQKSFFVQKFNEKLKLFFEFCTSEAWRQNFEINNHYHSLYIILNFDWLIYLQITACK